MALIYAIGLTFFIYFEQPHKKELNLLKKEYAHFLGKKEKQIKELKDKSQMMFNTAMKRSKADVELAELKRKIKERTSK